MARRRIAEGCDGNAYIDFDIDANNRLIAVIGRNAWISGKRTNGTGPTYAKTFGDVEETITIPTSVANRIQLIVRKGSAIDGFDANMELRCPTP